ncbi:MAG: GNAT family N-acetyltransferase [Blastocatellia bacterium]|nr:MAG: GNAT family N-acetyltransferase [Blastocatellia bacterium]
MLISIRLATRRDAEAITKIINTAFAIAEGFFIDGDRITLEEVIASLSKGEFLIAEDVHGLVGCVYLEPQGERAYLGLLSVDPSRQQTGLGSQLLKAAEEHRASQGSKSIYMKVVNLRTELPPYYRKRGYVETGTSPFPEGVPTKLPCWFIEMSKQLLP